jgi:hypothetical protein
MNPSMHVVRSCTKNVIATHNLLIGLCKSMWIINPLITYPSPHPRTLAHPFTPKVLRVKEQTLIIFSSVAFIFGFAFESFKQCEGASVIVLLVHVLQVVVEKNYRSLQLILVLCLHVTLQLIWWWSLGVYFGTNATTNHPEHHLWMVLVLFGWFLQPST